MLLLTSRSELLFLRLASDNECESDRPISIEEVRALFVYLLAMAMGLGDEEDAVPEGSGVPVERPSVVFETVCLGFDSIGLGPVDLVWDAVVESEDDD